MDRGRPVLHVEYFSSKDNGESIIFSLPEEHNYEDNSQKSTREHILRLRVFPAPEASTLQAMLRRRYGNHELRRRTQLEPLEEIKRQGLLLDSSLTIAQFVDTTRRSSNPTNSTSTIRLGHTVDGPLYINAAQPQDPFPRERNRYGR